MLSWALLTVTFNFASFYKKGTWDYGLTTTSALTCIYLAKFFYWETGYFNTLDIIMDRAGYYLCWGCLCWVQVL